MSEQNAEATETGAEGTEQQSQQPESQDLPSDHPLVKTLAAQKATIKELKSKASRLDELEEAQKSEAEKAADRIAKAESEAASVPAKVSDALKAHLVALHNIDADDAELFLTANDPEILLKQVTRLVESSGKRQKKNHVPREGNNPNSGPETDEREFVRGLFGGE
ncbi:hypothetical protein [Rhodococcus artemisiae]|uniref:Scaffolding protein n=1 Tax=Rhodococcus artemisiae TaxID=714159 RepID=A0ABU7LBP6_9NOCA|nr:hypothetical protein [Rhodococcus artemisiae]MEE2058966.1 hypothetical protein [Rhodococcus artemisiae]